MSPSDVKTLGSAELIKLEDEYGAHNYLPLDVVLTRGEGIWVYDVEGKKYLDFLSGYSCLNQVHCQGGAGTTRAVADDQGEAFVIGAAPQGGFAAARMTHQRHLG